MAVVKADAYGHGVTACAKALADRVDAFAVAITEEAIELRQAGITTPILVLQGPHEISEVSEMIDHSLWPAISNQRQLSWLRAHEETFDEVWLKVDTGMHRLGFDPEDVSVARAMLASQGAIRVTTMSHFAEAENRNSALTRRQQQRWEASADETDATSFSNSAGVLTGNPVPETWARLGYSLYGGALYPPPDTLTLKPVMTFSSHIVAVRWIDSGESVGYGGRWVASRRSKIAIIPVGYADGYPRSARDGTPIGTPFGSVPLAGKVSMDSIAIDVTDIPAVDVGTAVTLWGDSPGIDEVAEHCDTIGYELCTRLTRRVPRRVCP